MASETIREFLVQLGFKIDEPSLRKFNAAVLDVSKTVLAFGLAVEGAAAAVAVAVYKFAANLESMLYASQRTGTSIAMLKAMGTAAEGFGVSADEATNAVEALAAAWRKNPFQTAGIETMFGVKHEDLQQFGKALTEMGAYFREHQTPFYLAKQMMAQVGISDDKVLLMIMNGDYERQVAKLYAHYNDPAVQKAAEDARQLDQNLRDLYTRFDEIRIEVEGGILKGLQPEFKQLGEWLDHHKKDIENYALDAVHALEHVTPAIVGFLATIAKGWEGIFTMAKAAGQAAMDYMPAWMSDAIKASYIRDLQSLDMASPEQNAWEKAYDTAHPEGATPSDALTTIKNLTRWGTAGEHGKARGLFSAFSDPVYDSERKLASLGFDPKSIAALMANALAESGPGLPAQDTPGGSGELGIFQWMKPGQDRFAKWAGYPLSDPRATRDKQYEFLDYDLHHDKRSVLDAMLRAQTTMERSDIFTRQYENPKDVDQRAYERRTAAANMVATVTINVNGVEDVHGVARTTKSAFDNAVIDMQRVAAVQGP